ncbi:hypothetical protein PILCRDRAFT_814815 [Piloderma croceum F 1598]|uniref:Uncharacterized protein n=1 Tax=Piloderma croceum (strain F 1598) TaxID=765440 RepID=A0A0C3FSY8_PILCF|nr:hypothetical protein PILCRDRAFT_814815 [Piloderma croceum F 1598]
MAMTRLARGFVNLQFILTNVRFDVCLVLIRHINSDIIYITTRTNLSPVSSPVCFLPIRGATAYWRYYVPLLSDHPRIYEKPISLTVRRIYAISVNPIAGTVHLPSLSTATNPSKYSSTA